MKIDQRREENDRSESLRDKKDRTSKSQLKLEKKLEIRKRVLSRVELFVVFELLLSIHVTKEFLTQVEKEKLARLDKTEI